MKRIDARQGKTGHDKSNIIQCKYLLAPTTVSTSDWVFVYNKINIDGNKNMTMLWHCGDKKNISRLSSIRQPTTLAIKRLFIQTLYVERLVLWCSFCMKNQIKSPVLHRCIIQVILIQIEFVFLALMLQRASKHSISIHFHLYGTFLRSSPGALNFFRSVSFDLSLQTTHLPSSCSEFNFLSISLRL